MVLDLVLDPGSWTRTQRVFAVCSLWVWMLANSFWVINHSDVFFKCQKTDRQRDESSICSFTPLIAVTTWTGWGRSQARNCIWVPWMNGRTLVLGVPSAAFPDTLMRKWIRSEKLGPQLALWYRPLALQALNACVNNLQVGPKYQYVTLVVSKFIPYSISSLLKLWKSSVWGPYEISGMKIQAMAFSQYSCRKD